jgi:alpha-D-ribose 1-methylphosphonate 5-triphosphate diphosphatase
VVRDGLIHRINAVHGAPSRRIDCAGDYLLPGLIEIHTDNLERHIEPRPGTFWNTDRAVLSHDAELAAAGITTAFDAITLGGDVGERARERAYLDAIGSIDCAQSQGLLRAEHRLHLRCELGSPRLLEHLRCARDRREPRLVSLMEHVPGQGQWLDVERFRRHYARRYTLSEQDLDALIERRRADQTAFSAANRATIVEQAREHGWTLASHDDAVSEDVERAQQANCTIAEFPTTLEAAREAHRRGMYVTSGAPNLVRGGSHSGNVAASALASEGLVDIFSSDYCPSSLLHAVFCLAKMAGVPLNAAVATVSTNPARALDLHDRGRIEEGTRADLIRVRDTPQGPVVVAAWCAGRQIA